MIFKHLFDYFSNRCSQNPYPFVHLFYERMFDHLSVASTPKETVVSQSVMNAQLIEFPRERVYPGASQQSQAPQGVPVPARTPREAYGFLGLGGMRLTRRGRVLVWSLSLTFAVGVGVLLGQTAMADTPHDPQAVTEYVVSEGETLWSIAVAHAPTKDPRDTIDAIKDLNQRLSGALDVGEVLYLPTSS